MASIDLLFKPFRLKSLHLKNRFVMAPMTRSHSPDGVPTDEVAAYYKRRAEAEVGLIISEGTVIERPASTNNPKVPHFYGDQALQAWSKVLKEVQACGGVMAPQLWHVGVVAPHASGWKPNTEFEGPSGFVKPGILGGVTMSEQDIHATIQAFAKAAQQAKQLGFDCVEFHGAHGYLIDQFFWDQTNLRTDQYGGKTLAQRTRFAVDIIKATRKAVGEDFSIILRLSQWKSADYSARLAKTPQEMEEWLSPLVDAGVDMFHCSQRRFWESEFEGSDLNFAGWAKKVSGKPTITVGSIGLTGEFLQGLRGESSSPASIDNLLERFEKNEFDLVAIGRPLLSDPQWVKKLKEGRMSEFKGFDKDDLKRLY